MVYLRVTCHHSHLNINNLSSQERKTGPSSFHLARERRICLSTTPRWVIDCGVLLVMVDLEAEQVATIGWSRALYY